MHIKYERVTRKNGERFTYLCAVESYWDNGTSRQRRIKSFGCLEKQPDRVAFIKAVEAELPLLEEQFSRKIEISFSEAENCFESEFNTVYNYGYKYLEGIYNALSLDKYLDKLQAEIGGKSEYRIREIFKFLVFERILNPDSKRATIQRAHEFFGMRSNFSLTDIYRCMTLLAPKFDEVQDYIKRESDKLVKRDYSKIYYDCTNYYCEIDYSDTIENLRHKGVSKEHRVDPIIGFGLFLDNNGLPLKCQVFNGNIAESTMLIPGIRAVKAAHNLPRIVMVADKGLNTSKNIEELVKNGDGYVFSQILRGKKGNRFHEHILNGDGYMERLNEQGQIEYKYKLIEEEYSYTDKDGNEVSAKRKALIYYSLADDLAAKRKRAEKLLKAEGSLKNNAYGIRHGYDQYLKEDLIDEETGEVMNGKLIKSKRVDLEKAKSDERFDGYFCLITSELDYSEKQIIDTYKQLWEIEQTFRITKSDLEFRPVYHFKKENIKTHFLICYCAVFILRLLQYSLKQKGVNLSAERIVNALNSMNCENLKGIIKLSKPLTQEVFEDSKSINNFSNLLLEKPLLKFEIFRLMINNIAFHSISA
jgi:transposase